MVQVFSFQYSGNNVLINKRLLQFAPILHLNDLWPKHTSCLDDVVYSFCKAVLSKGDFASLLFKIVDPLLIKMVKSDVYTRTCTQLTFDLILGITGISRLGIHPYAS